MTFTLGHFYKFNKDVRSKLFLGFKLLLVFLSSCSKPDIQDYIGQHPPFNFKNFFTGSIDAWGIMQDFNGKVVNSFTLQISGKWQDKSGVITESFIWKDGSTTQRTWHLEQVAENQFVGRPQEGDSHAVGQEAGNTMHWEYNSVIPFNGESTTFDFDDWYYAIADGVVINKAKIQKFGLTVGDITIVMKKSQTVS